MKKDASPKKLFQPDDVGRFIVDRYPGYNKTSMSNFVTFAIKKAFEPKNKQLKVHYITILEEIEKNYNEEKIIADSMLRTILADICGELVYYEPCDVIYIANLFSAYITSGEMKKNYFYDIEVSNADQEFIDQYRLYLNNLDKCFSPAKREFGYILKFMIQRWDELKVVAESYEMLALIAKYGELKLLDEEDRLFSLIDAIDLLDGYLANSNRGDFCTFELVDFSPNEKNLISMICGEIGMYYANLAYSYLTGDYRFESVPNELRNLWLDYLDIKIRNHKETHEEHIIRVHKLRARFASFFFGYEMEFLKKCK